ncbi:hypothetical protein A2U94_13745 [Bacillus sp. VT 712]|uniref:hypothetical protein n=1 Tax=Bacillaceae TaxID=186817 RepID=UPI0004733B5D|nr:MULTISPECIES: hypothetical protein [Bacillaceae]KZB90906.1 hypothetical protein A2U94_13745 [Bacillus sp. VT 712]
MGKYDKHFTYHERSEIWREINNDSDVYRMFEICKSGINMVKEIAPKDRIREDIVDIEKDLGKIEIAFQRINEFPQWFTFNDEDILKLKGDFANLEKECQKLNMQRVSWN